MHRADVLQRAWLLAKANHGAPGVDSEGFEDIASKGLEGWLNGLGKELRDKTYRPQPVRRATIPKAGGGERALGIPTIRDRVVQTAAQLILEPILEADGEPNACGYRPKKSAQDAIREVDTLLYAGYYGCSWTPICRSTSTLFRIPGGCSAWLGGSSISMCCI
jgi:RNA-directed DNA polymerase